MKTLTQKPVTKGQIRQITRVGSDAIEKVLEDLGLDKEGAQRVHTHGDEFADAIREAAIVSLKELSVSVYYTYTDEKVSSSYTYPKEYSGPRPIEEQIRAIAEIFDLDPTQAIKFAKDLPKLPDGAEGWFAIPSVEAIAGKHFLGVTDPSEKYCRCIQFVHEKIAGSRKFCNYCAAQITSNHLRVHARTVHALDLITENQPGDILVIAAQLGMRHRGRSVRSTREVFVSNEFGLGSFAVGSIILTRPERLVRWEELDMDCSGDEFSPGDDGAFSYASFFRVEGGRGGGGVKFDTRKVDGAYGFCGSASGFVPQS